MTNEGHSLNGNDSPPGFEDTIVGVDAIAATWGALTGDPHFHPQRAKYRIYRGYIPARKLGTQWHASRRELEIAATGSSSNRRRAKPMTPE